MKANVSLSKIRHRSITDIERYQIRAVVEQVRQIPLHIDDGAMLDIHTFRYKLRRAIREHGIRVAIVDHLQIMDLLGRKGSTYFDDERQALDYAMRQFKETSREMDVAILVTSQLSRARSKRGSKDSRPKMSDLRGSGGIEQNADVVILLYREEFDRTDRDDLKGKAELIVAKQRDGPTGSVKMRFEDKFVRFVEDT
jgi:replicative DNA helicase